MSCSTVLHLSLFKLVSRFQLGPKRHDTCRELSTVYPNHSESSHHRIPSSHPDPGHMPIASLQADLFSVSSCLPNLRWELAFAKQFGLPVTLDLLSCNLLLGTMNAPKRDLWPTWPLSLRVLREMALWQVQADGVSSLAQILQWSLGGWDRKGFAVVNCSPCRRAPAILRLPIFHPGLQHIRALGNGIELVVRDGVAKANGRSAVYCNFNQNAEISEMQTHIDTPRSTILAPAGCPRTLPAVQ